MENFKAKYIFNGLLFALFVFISGIYVVRMIPWGIEFLENFAYFIIGLTSIILIGYTLWNCDERTQDDYAKLLMGKFLPIKFPGKVFGLIATILIIYFGVKSTITLSSVYNQHVVYNKQYDRATQGLSGFYDGLWKTYLVKKEIADINKDAFVQVATIIMDSRRDGQSLAWKWVQENSPIPFQEFTKFYSDLSAFITSKRDAYYALEVERQNIAASHNMLLDTFPNNVYNKVLKLNHIIYKYGFLSDSTNKVFQEGVENP